jgi:hypothetical protein
MNIHVRPAGLNEAADGVDDAIASALENVTNSLAPSTTAATSNPGWESAGALPDCRQAWADHLADLVKRTSGAAEKLRTTARNYQDVEGRITKSLVDLHWESE